MSLKTLRLLFVALIFCPLMWALSGCGSGDTYNQYVTKPDTTVVDTCHHPHHGDDD